LNTEQTQPNGHMAGVTLSDDVRPLEPRRLAKMFADGWIPFLKEDTDEVVRHLNEMAALLEKADAPKPEPYAIEAGFSNGDGTYSVSIERLPLKAWKVPVKDYPQRLLYAEQA